MNSRKLDYRVKVYGEPKHGVVFFFCGYGTRRWQFLLPFLPVCRMIWAGYQVVCYDFSLATGKESPQKSLYVLQKVYEDVADRVDTYEDKGVKNISCFGVSMGTLFAANSAAKIPAIQKVILNLPYGDIPEHILNFTGMMSLPKSAVNNYIAAAGGPEGLRDLMKDYSPVSLASKLSEKRVLLYHARKDKLLKYDNTVQLKNLLRENKTNLTYVENKKFGHYFSALSNNVRGSIYMNFLKAK